MLIPVYAPTHRDRYVSVDSCKNPYHGVGIGQCRIHHAAWEFGHFTPRHCRVVHKSFL